MLRMLLFVEPKPLPEHLFRNTSWLVFSLNILRRLAESDPNSFELHAAVPKRLSHLLHEESVFLENRVYPLDEKAIIEAIHRHGRTLRQTWNSEFLNSTATQLKNEIDDLVSQTLPAHSWDIVVTFGEECRYRFARDAMCLNIETSPFGRYPFKHAVFLDHLGLFRNSALARFFGPASHEQNIESPSNDVAAAVKATAIRVLESCNKLDFKREFENYILLPLQASNYSSFDAQTGGRYDTQLDYLFDICSQVSHETGIVITEHPEVGSIDRDNNFPMICQGLRDLFPNVTYLPRAKYFPSSSITLLNKVQGVWTLASNVGPVASFLDCPVGAPFDSHIAYSAVANSVPELENMINDPNPANNIDSKRILSDLVYEWMFDRYLVPAHKIDEPGWIAAYVKQRFNAFKSHGTSIESFTQTGLESTDFIEPTAAEHGPPGKQSLHYQTLLNQKIHLFRYQEMHRLQKSHANGKEKTFALLNHTAKLETFRHLGCNHVFIAIQKGLEASGFRMLYWLNGSEDIKPNQPAPDWVVINGEGSFHHNSCRATELMQIAIDLKSRGSKIALINSLWENNDPEHGRPLRQFDLVAVRDSVSQRELHAIGIPAIITPDFSIDQWYPNSHPFRGCQLMITDNIIYDRARKLFDASLHLDGQYMLLDHRKILQFNDDGCLSAGPPWRLSPNLLTHNCQIDDAEMVVTGRFHVAVARVSLGKPFVFVESNTQKISHLLFDIGIPPDALNVTEEVDTCDWRRLNERIVDVQVNFNQYLPLISHYCNAGISSINDIFSLIKNG